MAGDAILISILTLPPDETRENSQKKEKCHKNIKNLSATRNAYV